LATRPVSRAVSEPREAVSASPVGALVLAASLPLLFLHVEYQPGLTIDVGDTRVAVEVSDLALLAVVGTAIAMGRSRGFTPLRAGLPLWIAAGALTLWIAAATLYGPLVLDGYPLLENLVTAAKFAEYALLAASVPLLVRARDELGLVVGVLIVWSVLASVVALLQFQGLDVFDAWSAGRRQPSFLGHHDLAALSGAVFLIGLATLLLDPRTGRRRLSTAAIVSGGAGLALAAALASMVGIALALGALVSIWLWRGERALARLAVALALVAAVGLAVLTLRSGDVADFLTFAGDDSEQPRAEEVETYSQRTLLAYIGWRIFLDHPVLGVGWQGSSEPEAFEPQLDAARERFPDTAPLAFPSREHRYGVQNAYVQALADLGGVGFLLLVATFGAGVWLAARGALRGSPAGLLALLWLLLTVGLWLAQGLVTGIPLAGLTWLAFGLAVTGAAEVARG
jgi:hypothetical protein